MEERLENLIKELLDWCYKIYKKEGRGCEEANKLTMKIPVTIDGVEFSCWREYTTYKACQYLQEKCPEGDFQVNLDGNDSWIECSLTEDQIESLRKIVDEFLKEYT